MYNAVPLGALIVVVVAIVALLPPHLRGFARGKSYKMPPGPPSQPIFGNLLPWLRARKSGAFIPWVSSDITLPVTLNC